MEEAFNQKKEKCIETVLPAETARLQEQAQAWRAHRCKRKRERALNEQCHNKCFCPAAKVPIKGNCFVVAPHTRAEPALAKDVRVVDHTPKAAGGLFVVEDIAAPPDKILLIAILTGAAVIDPIYMRTGGSKGSAIAYMPAPVSYTHLTLPTKRIV